MLEVLESIGAPPAECEADSPSLGEYTGDTFYPDQAVAEGFRVLRAGSEAYERHTICREFIAHYNSVRKNVLETLPE